MRGDDGVLDAIARWANLPLEERIAERLAAILFAADEIRDMVALAQPSNAAAYQTCCGTGPRVVTTVAPSHRQTCRNFSRT